MSSSDSYKSAPADLEMCSYRRLQKPPRAFFYKDGDPNFEPISLVINQKHYKDIDRLEDRLTKSIPLPFGVRSISTPRGGTRVRDINMIQDTGSYVCSTKRCRGHGINLQRVSHGEPWHGGRPPTVKRSYTGERKMDAGKIQKLHPPAATGSDPGYFPNKPPKKITVISNKSPSVRHVILLNRKTTQTFEQVLKDLDTAFKYKICNIYTCDGTKITGLSGMLNGPDALIVTASDLEKVTPFKPVTAWGGPAHDRSSPRKPLGKPTVGQKLRDSRARQEKTRGKWRVTVLTNELPAAGTTSNVSITVYGKKNTSPIIPLYIDGYATFQAGSVDDIEISAGNIGEIYKIRMSHDNAGDSPGWLCDEVRMVDLHTDELLVFECRRWLSEDQDDRELCRELPALRPGEPVLPVLNYQLTVVTGEYWNAGTNASVYITLYGERGDTGVRRLLQSKTAENFCKGQSDIFLVEAVSLGKLKRLIIGHDGHGEGNGWFLEHILVEESNTLSHQMWRFPCHKWMDEGLEEGKIVQELRLEEHRDIFEKENWEKEKWKFIDGSEVRLYAVSTGCPLRIKPDASVDANGDYNDPLTLFTVITRRPGICAFRSVKQPRFHLAIDNAKLLGQGRGGAYCEMRVRVQSDRSIMFESVKYTSQYLAIQPNGKPDDPRADGLAGVNARRFYVYCKGVTRDHGTVMICTSLIQTLVVGQESVLFGTGKREREAHYRVHKVKEGGIRMFESVTHPNQYLRMQEGRCDSVGKGDVYCEFKVNKIRDQGYVTLESVANQGIFFGMTPDGRVTPTVDTGDLNTRFFLEIIDFGIKKGDEPKDDEPEPTPPPVETKPRQKRHRRQEIHSLSPAVQVDSPRERPASALSDVNEGDWKVWINTTKTAENVEVVLVVYGIVEDEDKNRCVCSGPIILGRAGENDMFATGNQDQFKVNLSKIGKIYKIRLELTATNDEPPTWLPSIVKLKDMTSKETLKFKVKQRLFCTEDDHRMMWEVAASRPDQPVTPVVRYRVRVKTGSQPASDTEANVYIKAYGDRGDWGCRRLFKSKNHTRMFEEGQVDEFKIKAVNLGNLTECVISHDGKDPGEGWFCEEVIISEDDDPTRQWVFPCNKWLDAGTDDRALERTLLVQAVPLGGNQSLDLFLLVVEKEKYEDIVLSEYESDEETGHSPIQEEEVQQEEPKDTPKMVTYIVEIYTGTVAGSDTKANAYIQIIGSSGDTGCRALSESKNQTMFLSGQQDVFEIEAESLGKLQTVVLGHDGRNKGEGWFVDKVIIKEADDRDKDPVCFPGGRWFDSGLDDKKIERELIPGEIPEPQEDTEEKYDMTVWVTTGSTGSDMETASVYLVCYGDKGKTDAMMLEVPDNQKPLFQPGSTDVFKLNLNDQDIGKMYKIRIGHESPYSSWFLEKIKILNSKSDEVFYFNCNRWLNGMKRDETRDENKDENEDDSDTWREYAVVRPGEEPLPTVTYTIEVFTGLDTSSAYTDADAYIHLFGSRGDSGCRALVKRNVETKLENGQKNAFKLEAVSLDKVQKVILGHRGDHKGEGCYVEKVIIQEGDSRENLEVDPRVFYFPCGRWFDVAMDDEQIERELLVGDAPCDEEEEEEEEEPEDLEGQYHVWVKTAGDSKVPGQARVIVTVYGENGKTDDIVLDLSRLADDSTDGEEEGDHHSEQVSRKDRKGRKRGKENRREDQEKGTSDEDEEKLFQPGNTDKFNVELKDLGELYKIRIGRCDTDDWEGWHLAEVRLQEKMTLEEYVFPFDRWMARDQDDWDIVRELPVIREEGPEPLPVLQYELAVYTGDHWAADTDANVYVNLYGTKGDTGKRTLYKSQNSVKFQRDQVDLFMLEAVSLEKVESIVVGHDGVGHGAGWFLDKIIITKKEKDRDRSDVQDEVKAADEDSRTEDNKVMVFYCGRWLDDDEDDGSTERKLRCIETVDVGDFDPHPEVDEETRSDTRTPTAGCMGSMFARFKHKDKKPMKQKIPKLKETKEGEWDVMVKTSEFPDAGTHAQVRLTVYGSKSHSGRLILGQGGPNCQDFEAGQISTHRINIGDIGDVYKIWIEQDDEYAHPAWHLDMLSMKDVATGEMMKFYADCWIAVDRGNYQLYQELPAIRAGLSTSPVLRYQVRVTTGNVDNADTSANVFFTLCGDLCGTGGRPLFSSSASDTKWQKGQTDVFIVEAVDVGKFQSVTLQHDGQERDTAWYIEKVVVKETSHALTEWVFPCQQWINPDPPDYASKKFTCAGEVIATDFEKPDKSSKENIKDEAEDEQNDNIKDAWTVWISAGPLGYCRVHQVHTALAPKGSVHLVVSGLKGNSDPSLLLGDAPCDEEEAPDHSSQADDPDRDIVEHNGEHNPEDSANDSNKATQGQENRKYKRQNTSKKKSKKNSKEEKEGEQNSPNGKKGDDVDHGDVQDEEKERDKPDLEPLKEVKISVGDIGEIFKIRLCSKAVDDWYMFRLKMKNDRTRQEFHFLYDGWVKVEAESEEGVLELPAIRPDLPPRPERKYEVSVWTGSLARAETEAQVYCNLVGHWGDTGQRILTKSSSSETKFRQDQRDVFELAALDLGDVAKVIIGHETIGRGLGWYCNHVALRVDDSKVQTIFPCNRWLDTGCEDRALERDLIPVLDVKVPDEENDDEQLETKGIWACLVTLNEAPSPSDADTDKDTHKDKGKVAQTKNNNKQKSKHRAKSKKKEDKEEDQNEEEDMKEVVPYGEDYVKGQLTLTVYGEAGQTGPLVLTTAEDHLKPGQTHETQVQIGSIGKITKVRICDGGVLSPEEPWWSVRKLVMEDIDTKEEAVFDFGHWSGDQEGHIRRELPLIRPRNPVQPLVAYQVAVHSFDTEKDAADEKGDNAGEDTENGAEKEEAKDERGKGGHRMDKDKRREKEKAKDKKEKESKNKDKNRKDRKSTAHEEEETEDGAGSEEDTDGSRQQVWLRLYGTRGDSGWHLVPITQPKPHPPPKDTEHNSSAEPKDPHADDDTRGDKEEQDVQKADKDKRKQSKEKIGKHKTKAEDLEDENETEKKRGKGKRKKNGDKKEDNVDHEEKLQQDEENVKEHPDSQDCESAPKTSEEEMYSLMAVELGTIKKVAFVVVSGEEVAVKEVVVYSGKFSAPKQVFPCSRLINASKLNNAQEEDATKTLWDAAGKDEEGQKDGEGKDPNGELVELTESSVAELSPAAVPMDETPHLPKSSGTWVVTTVTGPDMESGSVPEVVLVVCGCDGETEQIPLTPEGDTLSKEGPENTSKVEVSDAIGDIFKVRLGFAHPTPGMSWLLEKIHLRDEATDDDFSCDVKAALTVDEVSDGWLEVPVCWPSVPVAKVLNYEVAVTTGQEENAGTEANIHITLRGKGGSSGKRLLKKAVNHDKKFEGGQTDIFEFDAVDLGDLQEVIIGHDSQQQGNGWYLDHVVVLEGDPVSDEEEGEEEEDGGAREEKKTQKEERKTNKKNKKKKKTVKEWTSHFGNIYTDSLVEALSSGKDAGQQKEDEDEEVDEQKPHRKFLFPCSRWLDVGKDDFQTECILFVQEAEQPKSLTWRLSVQTSDPPAGEDPEVPSTADRLIVIYGEKGHSESLPLHLEGNTDYVAGNTNKIELNTSDIGRPYKVRLGYSDETEGNHSWHLDTLKLECMETGEEYEFDAVGASVIKNAEQDGWTEIPLHSEKPQDQLQVHMYQVEVFTGSRGGAGTDEEVYIQIWGNHGDTGRRKLLHSTREGAMFEAGKVDNFEVEAVDLEDLTKVVIGHAGKGIFSGWFLEKVIIKDSEHATKKFVFNCERWLDINDDDGAIERELEVSEVIDDSNDAKEGDWKVFVTTSDKDNSDTDALVTLTVFGDQGNSGPLPLGEPGKDLFKAEGTDDFKVWVDPEQVGKVTKIRIQQDNSGHASGWHLHKIVMEDLFNKETLEFPVDRWLCDDEDDGDVVRELPASWPGQEPLPVTKYVVQTVTGRKFGAGSDANVYITLHGEKGDSGKRYLHKNIEGNNKFEKGKTDTFLLEAIDLGPLTKVTIGHDQKGVGSGWYLNKVIVKESEEAEEELAFPCDRWLDEDEGDEKTEVELDVVKDSHK